MTSDFVASARAEFEFLGSQGFRLVAEAPTELLYESPGGVFVRIFHAMDDHYLGLRIGLMSEPRDALTESEMLRLAGAPTLDGLYPDPSEPVHDALTELARRLREYGGRPLAGDPTVFVQARVLRREYTKKFMQRDKD